MCGRHRPDKIYCRAIGCTNLPVRNGVCIIHCATGNCEIPGCTGPLFCSRKCNFHFKNLMVASPINKNTMGEEDLSNSLEKFNNSTEAFTVENAAMAMITIMHKNEPTSGTSNHLTIMHITDLPLGRIQEYAGMNNWEHTITFAAICKTWRIASQHHLAKIGIAHMEGGHGRKSNVTGFLSYLDQVKFRFAKRIYVSCGLRTKKLFYSEVKQKCPQMNELIHHHTSFFC
jgi:hypothetical protein